MIRDATMDDLPQIVAMSRQFYATTEYASFTPMDDDSVSNLAAMLIDEGIMLVVEQDERLVGMVGLVIAPFMFNNNATTAHEVVWWVSPGAHGLGIGKALIARVEPACIERGVQAIQMVHLASSPPVAAAIYRRMGYTCSETCFTKRLT